MKKHLWTFFFLVLAFVLYSIGMVAGAALFLLLGFAAELTFWTRIFGKKD